ncbi:Arc family DNA-binding protein [Rhizobium sp. 768_B6_N1_8]|uniref:Arc family DNA-binding protein n=1 Tax=unclassified Rhizobium TaxID=2613769 RepID=UPI003F2268F3
MSRDDPTFKLRITPDLKRKVLEAARANRRSMNAEIKSRLESTFAHSTGGEPAAVLRDIINRASALLKTFEDDTAGSGSL